MSAWAHTSRPATGPAPSAPRQPVTNPEPVRTAYSLPGVLASWFSIVEVPDAEPMAGELFRRSFNDYPPDVPHHYVARVSLDGEQRTIGYVHMRPLEDMFLCGGMCMDDRVFRHLPHERRAALKAVGGVAEQLLRHAF